MDEPIDGIQALPLAACIAVENRVIPCHGFHRPRGIAPEIGRVDAHYCQVTFLRHFGRVHIKGGEGYPVKGPLADAHGRSHHK